MSSTYTYLALGDSYTIGEGVPLYESFPYQVVQMMRNCGIPFQAPEIIAKTGWTTSELAAHMDHTILNTAYDFVSLLIGVNNQYRGIPSSHYSIEFEELLIRSITLAGEKSSRVFVLSIPDWGLTEFAKGRDTDKITGEIAGFNDINRTLCLQHDVNYIDITSGSPEKRENLSYLAEDGLHPSSKAYKRWAEMLIKSMNRVINFP